MGRSPTVGPLTPTRDAGAKTVSLALSRTSRVLAAALARVVPAAGGLRVGQLLTAADHAMLAIASELVDAHGLPAEQLRRLVDDLAAYRLAARGAASARGLPERGATTTASGRARGDAPLSRRDVRPEPASVRGGFLTLRAFGVRDEALARDILGSAAVRAGVIDRGFVTTLLDPDAGPAPTVDLGFLRQLVGALAAPAAQPPAEVASLLARREARGFLARALSALAQPTTGLAEVTPDRAAQGDTLLRARMPSLLDRLGAWLRAPASASHAIVASRPSTPGEVASTRRPSTGEPVRAPGASAPRAQPDAATPASTHAPAPSAAARVPLTRDDRALLKLLYSAAAERGTDLRQVDEVAAALVAYRRAERGDATPEAALTNRARGAADEAASAHAEAGLRGQAEPRTYEAPRSLPPAALTQHAASEPRTSTAARSLSPAPLRAPEPPAPPEGSAARGSVEAALVAHELTGSARSYGSTTQMAARLASSYGRLGPPSQLPPAPSGPADYVAREAAARAVALLRAPDPVLPFDPTLPLDLGQALGIGALFTELQRVTARTRRERRRRKRRQLMRAIGGLRHAARVDERTARDEASSRGARRTTPRGR